MVLLDFIVLGVLAGLCLGGRLSAIGRLRISGTGLLYGALAVQLVAFPSGLLPWGTSDAVARGLWLASYGLLFAASLMNRAIRGIPLIASGMAFNVLAILANGGHMPALPRALAGAHRDFDVHANSVSLVHPHLPWLVDRWAVPSWLPFGNVFSLGDVLIAVGAFVFVVAAMQPLAADRIGRLRHVPVA
jgi:uncharacterized protein DUF5317